MRFLGDSFLSTDCLRSEDVYMWNALAVEGVAGRSYSLGDPQELDRQDSPPSMMALAVAQKKKKKKKTD